MTINRKKRRSSSSRNCEPSQGNKTAGWCDSASSKGFPANAYDGDKQCHSEQRANREPLCLGFCGCTVVHRLALRICTNLVPGLGFGLPDSRWLLLVCQKKLFRGSIARQPAPTVFGLREIGTTARLNLQALSHRLDRLAQFQVSIGNARLGVRSSIQLPRNPKYPNPIVTAQ